MADDIKERQRRHPLQVTADRLRQHLEDYAQLFGHADREVVLRLAAGFDGAVEHGFSAREETKPLEATAPVNPGEPVDQRSYR